jgi:hypothetical protein
VLANPTSVTSPSGEGGNASQSPGSGASEGVAGDLGVGREDGEGRREGEGLGVEDWSGSTASEPGGSALPPRAPSPTATTAATTSATVGHLLRD